MVVEINTVPGSENKGWEFPGAAISSDVICENMDVFPIETSSYSQLMLVREEQRDVLLLSALVAQSNGMSGLLLTQSASLGATGCILNL